ncbi:N-acetyltransferase [Pseudomonas chlororaphis]|uniref:N-acetyltransferase n=1 Tax=Pseudomonas chlororaphis TaxID=587753 RepID=UPI00131FC083|nr:N-acetyltransferase [Pseudomonas chlororaphis]QHC91395.1 GNAT family N-acetyltransferase [Pseudomonas chlororaphis]
MPAITDPYKGLSSFQKALLSGSIKPKRCAVRRDLYFLRDRPTPDTIRMTYAMIVGRQVKAIAIYIEAEPNEGKRCFGVGYAVATPFRRQGLAKAILSSSMEEFELLLAPQLPEPGFYLEAIIGVDNEPSNRVAKQLISQEPEAIFDGESGLPALHYIKLVA